ncbi:hypothetical protein Tco_0546136 [Tanacetum coccineum]
MAWWYGSDGCRGEDDDEMMVTMVEIGWWGVTMVRRLRRWCLSRLRGLHYLLDKVVPAGTAPGPNNSDHNFNTITNGDGMQRVRTPEKQYPQNKVQ